MPLAHNILFLYLTTTLRIKNKKISLFTEIYCLTKCQEEEQMQSNGDEEVYETVDAIENYNCC